MTENLTYNEERVFNFLKGYRKEEPDVWYSPTLIGQVVGGGNRHSAWASPICLRLVKKGLIERNGYGKYRYKAVKNETN